MAWIRGMNVVGAIVRGAVLAFVTAATLAPPVAAETPSLLPIAEVRPGMVGVGRTVFEGSRIEEFAVEVIGVLENIGPRQSIILARLSGGPLATTGVMSGMSGSPVYVDGRLMGAVAYSFPFAKEPIAGITPIGEMIEATRTDTPAVRAASTRFPGLWTAEGRLAFPLGRDALMAAVRRPLRSVPVSSGRLSAGALPQGVSGGSLVPLSLPLAFSGFDESVLGLAREAFAGSGFLPVSGTAAKGSTPPLPDLAPGSAVGVSLIEGDLDVSATGTVTHVEGDRVYAFGHPFYNLGPTQFPMRKAFVHAPFPSVYQSWKITTPAEAVGTVEQDRNTAIAGRVGTSPRMIPVEVRMLTSRGLEKTYTFRMVDDELFTPVLAFMAVTSVLQGSERAFGTASIDVEATMELNGRSPVTVQDLFTEEQPAIKAAALVAAPLAYLMSNDFEPVRVERLRIDVRSHETNQSATLQRAWVERAGQLRAGTTVPLKLLMRTYRGEEKVETIPLAIPASAPAGTYTLLVADGDAFTRVEQAEMRQAFAPQDVDQLIRAINGLRKQNHVYARLTRPDDGAMVGGEHLPSLPPSVMSVLGGPDQDPGVVALRTASVWQFDLPIGHALTGARYLTLNIRR
jgi:hypothetical protein